MPKFMFFIVLISFGLVAQAQSVYIEDLTWTEVRDAIAAGKKTAIVYAGSTEQKGPHMAIGEHNFVAHYAAGRIAETLGDALVFPTLPYARTGDPMARTGHMRFPGSVSVSSYEPEHPACILENQRKRTAFQSITVALMTKGSA